MDADIPHLAMPQVTAGGPGAEAHRWPPSDRAGSSRPKASVTNMRRSQRPLSDQLICPKQERLRDRQPEGLGGLEVDDELELAGLLDRQVGGLRALEDLVHESSRAPLQVEIVCAIGHKTAGLRVLPHPQ